MALIAQINAPEEGLVYTANNTKLKIGEQLIGKGTLYISQNSLGWQGEGMNEGISLLWKQISIHGISANPCKCIYFMLDHNLEWRGVYDKTTRAPENNHNGNAEGVDDGVPMEQRLDNENDEIDEGNATDDEDERNDEQLTECWLIPDDANTVDIMFQAMTECQALHPDSADSISEESDFMDDEDGESFDNGLGPAGNSGRDYAEDAQGGMRNLNLNDDERFADADE
ncbi:PREDICTED: methylosome subunit pICln [Rhagoletis zephyria]|uniref:methylosome subunit pICln n=1 Tax=Rhagoletis zephyria TaxID=28612 RepID=UPI000811A584|nr:PREDICTED: methylosome subunit pICln [Rhagoletis zephyria]